MKYEAIIFDLFGTLIDNYPYHKYQSSIAQIASMLSVPLSDFTQLWKDTAYDRSTGNFENIEANIEFICQQLGKPINDDQKKHATQIRFDYISSLLVPRTDTIEVLSQLKSVGFKTGLISDCSLEVPIIWENTIMASLIDVAIFSSSVGLKKPDPEIYKLVVQRLKVKAKYCLYIGDGDSQELTGAKKAGMYPIIIRVDNKDSTQPYIFNREEWDGPEIASLKEILALAR